MIQTDLLPTHDALESVSVSAPPALPSEHVSTPALKAKCARKRSSSKSPTARTLELLRKEGFVAGVTEKWNPHARVRHDLFGFADVAAMRAGVTGTLYVQATSASNHSSRRAKLLRLSEVAIALAAHNRVEVWSWRKGRAEGALRDSKRKVWIVRKEALSLHDFASGGVEVEIT